MITQMLVIISIRDNKHASATNIGTIDEFIENCQFCGFFAENNGGAVLTSPNHTNNDREFNLTIDNCTLNNITAKNDGGSMFVHSNTLVTIANRNNGNGSGSLYMYQSVTIRNNYAINNLISSN